MEKQVIIIDQGNGEVSYMVGVVEKKSKADLEREIEGVENKIATLEQNNISSEEIDQEYNEKIEKLMEERDAKLAAARQSEENKEQALAEALEELETLKSLYETVCPNESVAVPEGTTVEGDHE